MFFSKGITQSIWWEGQRKERAACIRSDAAHSCGGKGLHISTDQSLQLHSFLVWPVHLLNLTQSQDANRDFFPLQNTKSMISHAMKIQFLRT